MVKKWLYWINLGLAGLIFLLALLTLGLYLSRPSEIPITEFIPKKSVLPKGSFTMEKEDYDAIGPPLLDLRFSPMTLQLPSLRNYLVYYGRNERPDSSDKESLLHFSFTGNKDVASIASGKPLYLVYDQNQPRVKYRFSPENEKTSLWIEATPLEKEAAVNVAMENEAGKIIREPEKNAQFKLRQKEFTRFGGEKWELGKWKVDGTLLARQRARWYGQDLFFKRHGGEQFKDYQERHRIDFTEGDDTYSIYVDTGDALAWIEDRWQKVNPGEESRKYPLLVAKKIDERLMKFDLWGLEGKTKVSLNLIKSTAREPPQKLEKIFKFVGARTRSQLMFEIKNKRLMISPKDWLLFENGEWRKLSSPEDIDNYVQRVTVGPLFIVDEIAKEEGRQVLKGVLFNAVRTEMTPVEIPLQQSPRPHFSPPNSNPRKQKQDKNEELSENEDFDEDFEENRGAEARKYMEYAQKQKYRSKGKVPNREAVKKTSNASRY